MFDDAEFQSAAPELLRGSGFWDAGWPVGWLSGSVFPTLNLPSGLKGTWLSTCNVYHQVWLSSHLLMPAVHRHVPSSPVTDCLELFPGSYLQENVINSVLIPPVPL